jgi:hypothetical protein
MRPENNGTNKNGIYEPLVNPIYFASPSLYTCIYKSIYTYIYTYVYIHTHTNKYIYINTYMYLYIHI